MTPLQPPKRTFTPVATKVPRTIASKATESPKTSPEAAMKVDKKPNRGARGYHKFNSGLLNVTPKGNEIAIMKRNAGESPLLQLPPEIRNRIWKFALAGNIIRPTWSDGGKSIVDNFYYNERSGLYDPLPHRLSLLRVCRQIYQEAAAFTRHVCIFRFFDFDDLRGWMARAPADQRKAVGVVQFGLQHPLDHASRERAPLKQLGKAIPKLPNLNVVDIKYTSPRDATAEEVELTLEVLEAFKADMEQETDVRIEFGLLSQARVWRDMFKVGTV